MGRPACSGERGKIMNDLLSQVGECPQLSDGGLVSQHLGLSQYDVETQGRLSGAEACTVGAAELSSVFHGSPLEELERERPGGICAGELLDGRQLITVTIDIHAGQGNRDRQQE